MLDAIVIENFQSFREPVEVPLAPITLLYGPNSAGKSAVLDALALAKAIFTDDERTLLSLTMRQRHQPKPGQDIGPIKLRMQAHAELNPSDGFFNSQRVLRRVPIGDLDDIPWKTPGSVTSEVNGEAFIEWTIECWPDPYMSAFRRLTIDINGHPTLGLELMDEDGIETELSIDPTVFGTMLTGLAEQSDSSPGRSGAFVTAVDVDHGPLQVTVRKDDPEGGDWFLHVLATLANWLLHRSAEILAPPVVVPADRGVIADRDLIVFVRRQGSDPLGLPRKFTSLPQRDLLSRSVIGGSDSWIIQQIALARVGIASASLPEGRGPAAGESMDVFVNRCLADHLFLDAGYQVRFDVCEVLPPSHSKQGQQLSDGATQAAVVICTLADRDDRKLTFEDVGTGISCVLPVLGAWHSGFSFVQQPELHLHPALQASLADVAIEVSSRLMPEDGSQNQTGKLQGTQVRRKTLHILETHSEYILLRCLRRLRQTAQGLHPDGSPQRFTPAQISVLYFDPRPDGSTKVRKIRLTEDGEFIDRWPRGFFEERGRELFDE
jgi:hypothetical protein